MALPLITLTTDFGLSDHYVGVMKGVILKICPQARIVDITHDIPSFAISQGALAIGDAYRYFPRRTVHVVVVDPGVGSSRRPILVQAAGQFFVAPDNGVLEMIFGQEAHTVRAITNSRYFLKPVSRTFHGRDIFSPVAAHLAAGIPPARIGDPIDDHHRAGFAKPRPAGEHAWTGAILKIDRFGNIVTNFRAAELPELKRFVLRIGSRKISALALSYAERSPGELFVIVGSSGYLEISMNQGSAAGLVRCQPGAAVRLTFA